MGVETTKPYSPPTVYFPVGSDVPATTEESIPANAMTAMDDVVRVAKEITEALDRQVLAPFQLNAELIRLGTALSAANELLTPNLSTLADSTSDETSCKATKAQLETELSEETDERRNEVLTEYVLYDRFFQVTRVSSMTTNQFMAQAVATSLSIARDLPFAVVNVDEIRALVKAMSLLIADLSSFSTGEDADEDLRSTAPETVTDYQAAFEQCSSSWSAATEPDDWKAWTNQVAMYRWRAGHHFFDISAMFGRFNLERAGALAQSSGDDHDIASFLDGAKDFLRATTAAMWYAGNFPKIVYEDYVREQMKSTEMPDGFSGHQNADYARMRTMKTWTYDRLSGRYGRQRNAWPVPVYDSLRDFHETDVQDNEHHTLIAAAKVGMQQSLYQDELGGASKNAVETLREMTQQRISEVNGRFDR